MTNEFKLLSEITFIKCLAIVYITVIYAIGGIWLSAFADRKILRSYYHTQKEDDEISTGTHLKETVIILSVLGILTYIGRNVLQKIPFPLDGVLGFDYMRVPEVVTGGLLGWTTFIFSGVLDRKIKIINERLSNIPFRKKQLTQHLLQPFQSF
jgi:hypothetical protein